MDTQNNAFDYNNKLATSINEMHMHKKELKHVQTIHTQVATSRRNYENTMFGLKDKIFKMKKQIETLENKDGKEKGSPKRQVFAK